MRQEPAQLANDLLHRGSEAFEPFFLEMRPLLYHYGLKLTHRQEDAEDLVQETFLRAFLRISQLRDVERVGQWLLSIAHNVWRASKRKRSSQAETEAVDAEMPASVRNYPSPESNAISTEFAGTAEAALRRLPELYQTPVLLRAESGLSMKEIASRLGVCEPTVRSRLHRARDEMSQHVFGYRLAELHSRRRNGMPALPVLPRYPSEELDRDPHASTLSAMLAGLSKTARTRADEPSH